MRVFHPRRTRSGRGLAATALGLLLQVGLLGGPMGVAPGHAAHLMAGLPSSASGPSESHHHGQSDTGRSGDDSRARNCCAASCLCIIHSTAGAPSSDGAISASRTTDRIGQPSLGPVVTTPAYFTPFPTGPPFLS
ncbi:MAG: hypothetical protein R2909_12045 [Gemmatimonadales bacterium]